MARKFQSLAEQNAAYARVLGDYDGRELLEDLKARVMEADPEDEENLFGDVPHPFRGYCVIGCQRLIRMMEDNVQIAHAHAADDPPMTIEDQSEAEG